MTSPSFSLPISEGGRMEILKMKRVEGSFDGIAYDNVEEPVIAVVSYYPTVRYGCLPKFKLLIPKGAKATKTVREWYSERFPGEPHVHVEYTVAYHDKVWHFTLCRGDAAEPDTMYQGEDEYAKENPPTISHVWELDPDE
jgi:hypothetical protein